MGRPVILYVILSGVRQHGVEESVFLFLRMEFAGRRGRRPLHGGFVGEALEPPATRCGLASRSRKLFLRMEFVGIRILRRACAELRYACPRQA